MATDGIFLHFLKNEIADFATGAKVDKIYLPSKYEMVMTLRTRTESKKLFISVGGNAPRLNFTDYTPENPAKPPMLCMLLRKQLTGAVVTGIRQAGLDRIIFIDFNATDEIGDRVKRTLVIEIMAQYSNCILLDENEVIIDSLKRVDASKSSVREILPKLPYRLPPAQNKADIRSVPVREIVEQADLQANKKLSSALLGVISGMSPLVAKEIAYRVTLGDPEVSTLSDNAKERLIHELNGLKQLIENGESAPCRLKDENGKYLEFSYLPLTLYSNSAKIEKCGSLSEILDSFYYEREKFQRAKSKAEDLFKAVSSLTERTARKINMQREDLKATDDMDTKRLYAELINSALYSLKKGDKEYNIPNYYDDYNMLTVPADPLLTPSQNSQKYYKEYRKAQTARKVLTEQIEKGIEDLEYLATVEDELKRSETEKELNEIRAELSACGFLKSKTGTKNKKNAPMPPIKIEAPDGFIVYVGRNNLQNDELSFRRAQKNDVWFHAQKAPGSHVVLSTDGKEPTDRAMEFAAETAAYYSSVRERGMVEVDYTKIRNLKKPPASRPGFVIYHIYNTVYVKAIKPEDNK